MNGSLLDYALKKEKLLLQTEPTMSDRSRINHIVVGLPFYIQDRLDKEEIQTTEQLMNQLRRYTQAYPKKKGDEIKSSSDRTKRDTSSSERKGFMEKRPCTICQSKGYPGRYHPLDLCRNKGYSEEKRVNLNEFDEVNVQEQEKNVSTHH